VGAVRAGVARARVVAPERDEPEREEPRVLVAIGSTVPSATLTDREARACVSAPVRSIPDGVDDLDPYGNERREEPSERTDADGTPNTEQRCLDRERG
jgi:hypothetical protein